MNLHDLHHDPEHWPEPEEFRPARFLSPAGDCDGLRDGETGNSGEGIFAGVPPAFKPFGTGRRVCVGEALAKSELLVSSFVLV